MQCLWYKTKRIINLMRFFLKQKREKVQHLCPCLLLRLLYAAVFLFVVFVCLSWGFCFLLQSVPISCAGHSAPPSLLLRTTVMGPSGKALIMFHASNRVMSCRLIPWTCNTSSPLCRPLCSAAPPEISKRHFF